MASAFLYCCRGPFGRIGYDVWLHTISVLTKFEPTRLNHPAVLPQRHQNPPSAFETSMKRVRSGNGCRLPAGIANPRLLTRPPNGTKM